MPHGLKPPPADPSNRKLPLHGPNRDGRARLSMARGTRASVALTLGHLTGGAQAPELLSGVHPRATERRIRRAIQRSGQRLRDVGAYSRSHLPLGRHSLLPRASTVEHTAATRVKVELEGENPAVGGHANLWALGIGGSLW